VIRALREEYLNKNLKPSFKSGYTSIRVWSCYYSSEIGPLVILKKGGRITVIYYLEIVKKHYVPFYKCIVEKYRLKVVL